MSTIDHQPARPVADDWDWQLSAVCRGMDVDAFYQPAGERLDEKTARIGEQPAKAITDDDGVIIRDQIHRTAAP